MVLFIYLVNTCRSALTFLEGTCHVTRLLKKKMPRKLTNWLKNISCNNAFLNNYVIHEMVQTMYMIHDFEENRLVFHERENPLTTLYKELSRGFYLMKANKLDHSIELFYPFYS